MEKKQKVSRAVIHRIPRYYRYVSTLRANGVQRISSRSLAESMGLTASQIRQDFNCFGGFGQQGYGYNVEKLYEGLGEILGINRQRKAILVGAGNLGKALMKNFDFKSSGFDLVCAFDSNEKVIGTELGGIKICDATNLYSYVSENKPDIAVLTVPYSVASEIARNLVEHGIRGLWNFTGGDLHLEGKLVPVENVHFSDSVMILGYAVDTSDIEVVDE